MGLRINPVQNSRGRMVLGTLLSLCFLFSTPAVADPVRGLEASLAVLELYVDSDEYTKTPVYALRVTDSITEIGKFAVLSREDTASQVAKSVSSSSRRDTEDKLKKVEAALQKGDQLVYEDPQQAIEVLGRAKADLMMIMDQISLNKKIRRDLFLTQMLLASSHFFNDNRDKSQQIMAEIIRVFGDGEKVTEEDYHPSIVALYRETYRQLSEQRHCKMTVRTEPAGAEVLINGRVQDSPSPGTYEGLYPGPVTVVARKDGRESLAHKVELKLNEPLELDIDIDFETATAFDGTRFGLVFPDTETLDRRLPDFASRIGKILNVDYVLVTGLVNRGDKPHIEGHLVHVAKGQTERKQSLYTKANVVSNNRVVEIAQQMSGVQLTAPTAPIGLTTASEPWYTNWIGWSLVGGAAVSGVVGIAMFMDYQTKADQFTADWTKTNCNSDNLTPTCEGFLPMRDDANTSSYVAGGMAGLAGAATAGAVLVFLLMPGDAGDVALPDGPQLKLEYAGPAMLPGSNPGVGFGFSF